MNMHNKKWANDFSPIDPEGASIVDRVYSKAYLRHLIMSDELLGMQIASIHNLAFYVWLTQEARAHIIKGDFSAWKASILPTLMTRL